jgi:hypothetical protein
MTTTTTDFALLAELHDYEPSLEFLQAHFPGWTVEQHEAAKQEHTAEGDRIELACSARTGGFYRSDDQMFAEFDLIRAHRMASRFHMRAAWVVARG